MKSLSFEEFKKYVFDNKSQLLMENGECKTCPKAKLCHKDNKIKIISSIYDLQSSRFPMLLKITKRFPILLHLVHGSIYEKIYGFYPDILPCPFISSEVVKNIDNIEKVYNLLTDKNSKDIYLNLLMYRITLNRNYLSDCICKEPQYFIDAYTGLDSNNVVVDCGGYTGDTMMEYLSYNSPPRKYYIYEPDHNNIEHINEKIENSKYSTEFVVSDKGLYKKNTTLWFVGGKGSSSYTSEKKIDNSIEVSVISIDEDIADEVSFIKMDIEGFEKNAIIGAKNHIKSSYPRLAICIYHSINDMWEIPLLINEEFPNYRKYVVRHYENSPRESVIYAYND